MKKLLKILLVITIIEIVWGLISRGGLSGSFKQEKSITEKMNNAIEIGDGFESNKNMLIAQDENRIYERWIIPESCCAENPEDVGGIVRHSSSWRKETVSYRAERSGFKERTITWELETVNVSIIDRKTGFTIKSEVFKADYPSQIWETETGKKQYYNTSTIQFWIIDQWNKWLSNPDVSTLDESKASQYETMVRCYRNGQYSDSLKLCESLRYYRDVEKYRTLLTIRLEDLELFSTERISELVNELMEQIDFEDSASVLVCNQAIAQEYLRGYWLTSNGMLSFEMKGDGTYSTTVPVVPQSGDKYEIKDGIIWRYYDSKPEEKTSIFKIEPLSAREMELFSYKVNGTYKMIKRR